MEFLEDLKIKIITPILFVSLVYFVLWYLRAIYHNVILYFLTLSYLVVHRLVYLEREIGQNMKYDHNDDAVMFHNVRVT